MIRDIEDLLVGEVYDFNAEEKPKRFRIHRDNESIETIDQRPLPFRELDKISEVKIILIPFDEQDKPLIIERDGRVFPDESKRAVKYKEFFEYLHEGKAEYFPNHPAKYAL